MKWMRNCLAILCLLGVVSFGWAPGNRNAEPAKEITEEDAMEVLGKIVGGL